VKKMTTMMTVDDCPDVHRITFLPEMTDSDLALMQAEDDGLGPAVEWLKMGRHLPLMTSELFH